MALINRIARVFKADVHAVLDQVEQPDLLLRQSIREMEEALLARRESQRRREAEVTALLARQTQLETTLKEIEDHLDVCFASGEEGLARDMTRKKLENQRLLQHLIVRYQDVEQRLERSRTLEVENQAVIESMRQKLEVLASNSQVRTAVRDHSIPIDGSFHADSSEVEAAFLKEKQRRAKS